MRTGPQGMLRVLFVYSGEQACFQGYWHTNVDSVSYLVAIKVFATPSSNYKQLVEEVSTQAIVIGWK